MSRERRAVASGGAVSNVGSHHVIGANFPWWRNGWDFGTSPYGGQSAIRSGRTDIEANLDHLKRMGVEVVRFFVLAGGKNYPEGGNVFAGAAPALGWNRFGGEAPTVILPGTRAQTTISDGEVYKCRVLQLPVGWRPPTLSVGFLSDFRWLIDAVASRQMKLLPSFMSFEFIQGISREDFERVHAGGHGYAVRDGGRVTMVFGNTAYPTWHRSGAVPANLDRDLARGEASEVRASLRRFLDATLAPLLAVSNETPQRRATIDAWEIMNEPDWAIHRGNDRTVAYGEDGNTLVRPSAMLALFEEAGKKIHEGNFRVSIGFANGRVEFIPGFRDWLLRQSWSGSYVHQHHHYPKKAHDDMPAVEVLPSPSEMAALPCYIGEFPTRFRSERGIALALHRDLRTSPGDGTLPLASVQLARKMDWKLGPWRDSAVASSESDRDQYLVGRLRLIRDAQYAGSFGWIGMGQTGDLQYGWNTERDPIITQYTAVTGGRP